MSGDNGLSLIIYVKKIKCIFTLAIEHLLPEATFTVGIMFQGLLDIKTQRWSVTPDACGRRVAIMAFRKRIALHFLLYMFKQFPIGAA